jgi:hypothetical protein
VRISSPSKFKDDCRAQLPLLLIKDVRGIIPDSLRIKVGLQPIRMPADALAAEVGFN